MSHTYPWDLRRVPNYDSAKGIDVEKAGDLDEDRFRQKYVLRNRPCLIKQAVIHWPAHTLWLDPEYLLAKIGDVEVRASREPKVERFGLRSEARDEIASTTTTKHLLSAQKVRSILPRLLAEDDEVLFIELRPTEQTANSVGLLDQDMLVDGARFPFFRDPPKPRFLYSVWGAMFYKNSYSDWHFHPGTDAIMCQPFGTKEVLLLPPTQQSWDQLVPIHDQQWSVYDVDGERYPGWRQLQPLRVIVEPGDGLFIPVNWWHAVQAIPGEFGATVPLSWDSPYCDLAQPATRHFLRKLWRMQKPLAAKVFVEATLGTIVGRLRPLTAI